VFLGLIAVATVATLVLVFRNNQDLLNERFTARSGRATFGRQDSRRLVGFALWRDSAHSVRCVPISLVCKAWSDRISVGFTAISGGVDHHFAIVSRPILCNPRRQAANG